MLVGISAFRHWRNYCRTATAQRHCIGFMRRICLFIFLVNRRTVPTAETCRKRVVPKKEEQNVKISIIIFDMCMKNLIKTLSILTFLLATITVASIFYEGMILQWLSYVGISIYLTDIFFLIATVVGVFYYKDNKILFYSHLFSIFVILVGIIITLIFGKNIPKILFLLWEFYILYFYGIIVCKKLWQSHLNIRNH